MNNISSLAALRTASEINSPPCVHGHPPRPRTVTSATPRPPSGNDPGKTRTCNLWFRRPTPYPLGHRALKRMRTSTFQQQLCGARPRVPPPPRRATALLLTSVCALDERRAYAKVRADGLGLKLAIWPAPSLPPRTVLSSGAALHFHVGTGVRAVEP